MNGNAQKIRKQKIIDENLREIEEEILRLLEVKE